MTGSVNSTTVAVSVSPAPQCTLQLLAAGHEPSDELARDISQFVRTRLSQYAYPRRIEFVDDLPKTLTGKIRRIELREREHAAAAAT